MQFSQIFVALVAAVAQAQPLESAHQVDEAELAQLAKRSDASFTTYTDRGCSGTGEPHSPTGNGAKDNFAGTRKSLRLSSITPGFHLTLYSAKNQAGIKDPRLNSGNVGQCWDAGSANWLSWGLFNDN
ncbi:hypothetical protein F4808DRAFT_467001 [Astrocystis sublimbata]|nr:hypothetical protein F4808DRAFT_467001 [Astrocystis sublimbata]